MSALTAGAQPFKCETGGRTIYQQSPCESGATRGTALRHEAALGAATRAGSACKYFDAFKDNKDGTVLDPRNGLVWQRCAIGQSWAGGACRGEGQLMTLEEATMASRRDRFAGRSDWRLPTIEELKSVMGKRDECDLGKQGDPPWRAVSPVFPAVKKNGSVNCADGRCSSADDPGMFWSSSTYRASTYTGTWLANFTDASVISLSVTAISRARVVRAGP